MVIVISWVFVCGFFVGAPPTVKPHWSKILLCWILNIRYLQIGCDSVHQWSRDVNVCRTRRGVSWGHCRGNWRKWRERETPPTSASFSYTTCYRRAKRVTHIRLPQIQLFSGDACWSCVCADKRAADEKMSSTQALLQQQEESLRRADRDRRALNERIKELERLSLNTETERKRVEVRLISFRLTSSRKH